MNQRSGHGWWPYLLPYVSFLVMVEIARRVPESWGLPMLALKPAVPAALVAYYFWTGHYPELRAALGRSGGLAADVAVGVGLAALWMAPYVLLPALRPVPAEGFDPAFAGEAWAPLALCLRFAGYALVTPVFEELFIRSFVMRYSEVYPGLGDFRDQPIARFTLRSFIATTLIFSLGHVPWEWWVAVPWVVLTSLWFYHRGTLHSVILVHGVTNATILAAAWAWSGRFSDFDGQPLSLWFFV